MNFGISYTDNSLINKNNQREKHGTSSDITSGSFIQGRLDNLRAFMMIILSFPPILSINRATHVKKKVQYSIRSYQFYLIAYQYLKHHLYHLTGWGIKKCHIVNFELIQNLQDFLKVFIHTLLQSDKIMGL